MKNFGKTTDIRDIITVGYEADNAVLYSTSQSLTNNQKAQARTNIGAGTSNFDGDYKSLANKPTIPTKTSQLNNDSNFATTSQVEAKYTKPASGIPKTDLATAVQNSLTAADNAVRYTSQSLTDAQKVQARTNIGAGTSNFSGSYNDLTNRPTIPAAVSIVQSTGESTSSVMSQKATTDAVNSRLSKTDNTNIEVLGTKKATTTLGGNQLYAPNGVIFGGSAAAAGLVTKGICGVSTPSVGGACSKENLYINYDGNNDFNAGRQVVLNAGTVGNHLGSNMYQYTVPRGDIVKNWVEAKGYATTSQVDAKQDAITASNKLSASLVSGLATVATSGSYNDLTNKPTNYVTTDTEQTITSKKTFNGEVKFGSTENFQGYYIKRMLGSLGIGTRYENLDSKYKDGTYHRMWRLRFPSGSSFWGKIKVTLYGDYSSFNASGVMSKSITCNFNTSNIYNNVGCYDGLGVNVEQDFRISEAIWNATANAWEVLIWQQHLNGNNPAVIMLECWTKNNTNYINAFNGIAAQAVELTQMASYSAQKASLTGGTKTVEWAVLPVYENPLGEEIATAGDLSNKANLSGGNTFTGKQTLNSPASDGYSINASGYIRGSWLQSTVKSNHGSGTGMVCVFDNNGWIYYRTPAEILEEAGGGSSDNSKHGYTQLTNEDLNTITEVGWYRAASNSTCANKPSAFASVPFVLEVEKSTDAYIKQTLYRTGNSVSTYSTTYVRYSSDSGSSWASWGTNQIMHNGATQSFSGLKYFIDGIQLGSAVYTTGSYGSSGQFFMSQGSSSAPKWVNLQVKVNGTTYTADSSGLIDLGTISGGGTTAYATQFNEIY